MTEKVDNHRINNAAMHEIINLDDAPGLVFSEHQEAFVLLPLSRSAILPSNVPLY